MKPLDYIFANAKKQLKHIVLAEGEDPRIIEAGIIASKKGLAKITLLGDVESIIRHLMERHARKYIHQIIDPSASNNLENYANAFMEKRKHKNISMEEAFGAMKNPLGFAAMMVAQGDADGTIAGAVATTADTVRNALQIIGKAKNSKIVSSFFLMLSGENGRNFKGGLIFADCGLVIEPDSNELAEIAMQSAVSCKMVLNEEPQIAMLSFSSGGSAKHKLVSKVVTALELVRKVKPDLIIDGEIQFDAAFVDTIREQKMVKSTLTSRPNIYIFPSLEAGNIGYKIAQQLGGLQAIGPVLQGLAKPANDLSRGCTVDDIVVMIAITSVQSQFTK